jgi:hypothetical protein
MTSTEIIPWHCGICEKPAQIQILDQWDVIPGSQNEYDPFKWLVGRCLQCLQAFVFIRELPWLSEDIDLATEQIFPEKARTLPMSVPRHLRETFDEANRCMTVKSYSAVSLLARKVVEGFCLEMNADGTTLASKLSNLREKGDLDEKLYSWSSTIRDLGNQGAHDIKKHVSREDASDVIKFVEALLDYQYVFQARYQEFLARRQGNSDIQAL